MKKIALFLLGSTCVYSLNQSPWLGEVYSFNLKSDFAFSYYRHIDQAKEQPAYTYKTYLTRETLSLTASSDLEVELELELARTPFQFYGFRSSAIGAKYRLLDDIAGDFVSLVLAANMRAVGGRAVRDVNCPYASYFNSEVMASVGKEFTKGKTWHSRGYLAGVIGLANHGSAWNRFEAVAEGKFLPSHVLQGFMTGYFGYGPKNVVNIDHFDGWGKISHRSIDLGLQYRYCFEIWGDLGLSYAYRVFAKSYPENAQTFQISYNLPFSLF